MKQNSGEMKVWAIIFGLTILVAAILVVLALMEEQGTKRAAIERSAEWIVDREKLSFLVQGLVV